MPNVEYGGTGFYFDKAPNLPYEIEHHMPDYHLYDDFISESLKSGKMKPNDAKEYQNYSIGFTTRGCIRGCSFCVNRNKISCVKHSSVYEFLDPSRPYIYLLDDNILANKDWKSIFEELNSTGKKFCYHQGLDERLLTDEKCEIIFNSNWLGEFIFAFDNIDDRDLIEKKLKMIRQHTDKTNFKFYLLCGYNHYTDIYDEDFWVYDIITIFERIKILMKYKMKPYIMRHANHINSPYRGMYVNFSRWCNQPSFVKTKSFREFARDVKGNGIGTACYRYMEEFEKRYPDIASEYYDMKWSDF